MLLPVAGQCVLTAGIRGSGKSEVLNLLRQAEALLEAADRIRTARCELLARQATGREWRPTSQTADPEGDH